MEKFTSSGNIERILGDCQSLIRRESEDFLRWETEEKYEERQKDFWKRDYSSVETYLKSIKENRKHWKEYLGDFSQYFVSDFSPEKEKIYEDDKKEIFYLKIRVTENLNAYALIGYLKKRKTPSSLIIAQHGIGSSPFHVFGFYDRANHYHDYGMNLLEEGYTVLAPFNITESAPRARIQRLCLLLRKSVAGLEVTKYKRWIDYIYTMDDIDKEKIGMWGLSLGGYYTLITLPVEERIKLGICSAFFNHRIKKMIIDDPRYSCFLSTEEEHIFIPGWLEHFSDKDLVSLICPRPFMIQAGKQDAVSWWEFLANEFEETKKHYEKLKAEENIVLDLHSGGHEIRVKQGIDFINKFFKFL